MSSKYPPVTDPVARANAIWGRKSAQARQSLAGQSNTAQSVVSSGIGDALQVEFGSLWIAASTSCACKHLQAKLNAMTAEQVRSWSDLPALIAKNADSLDGLSGILVRTALKVAMPLGLRIIARCIERAIERAKSPVSGGL